MGLTSFVDGLDDLMSKIYSTGKVYFTDYSNLETVEDEISLVTDDASLVTLIRVDGIQNLIDGHTFMEEILPEINAPLSTQLNTKAHAMQIWFESDPDRSAQMLSDVLKPSVAVADRLEMDMDDLFMERIDNLSKWVHDEKCYIALWTRPSIMSKSDTEAEKKRKSKETKVNSPSVKRGQNNLISISAMVDNHHSYVHTIAEELNGVGISCSVIHVPEATREIRKSIDYEFTDVNWEPILPGKALNPHQRKQSFHKEEWDVVWPKLSSQIIPRDAEQVDRNIVRVGDTLYSPIYISLFPNPSEIRSFNDLFIKCKNKRMPWRVSFLIEGEGMRHVNFKAMVASVIGFASPKNILLKNAAEALKGFQNEGGTVVKLQASFSTWAKAGQEDLVRKRSSDLARIVETWGGCQVAEITGDPLAGFMSSTLAATDKNIGTAAAAPLYDALKFLPLSRPASPWEDGAVLFRSPDGKLMPYQPYSDKQTTWINLIFARPGSGKSVLMNVCNLALCLAPGNKELPRIAIIDVGPSSSGLISLIKESLPPEKQHLAAYHRLKMIKEHAINPFDTLLGCRYPTTSEKSFLNNLISLLVTDPSKEKPETGMSDMVNAVIDDMYKRKSDKIDPNRYNSGIELEIDELLGKLDFGIDSHTTWWEIVDFLFLNDYIHEASLAQRHAVPVLSDAATSAKDEKIMEAFNITLRETGEHITSAFVRLIGSALETFPVFSQPTRFDIGEARVISLDLDEVAKGGGDMGKRITSVMYMLARQVTAKKFYLNKETVGEIPGPDDIKLSDDTPVKKYKEYHQEVIRKLLDEPKRICYDEFHRTSGVQAVRDQVVLDMREGRKWKIDIMLSSQLIDDFDDKMMEVQTGLFVMDKATPQTINSMSEKFGFSTEAEKNALRYSVHAPRAGGGTFLVKFQTNIGTFTMLASATLGPIELWAFSTTAQDMAIRNELYQKIGPKRARQILAMVYPGGTASKDIKQRQQRMQELGYSLSDSENSITDEITEELIELNKKILSESAR